VVVAELDATAHLSAATTAELPERGHVLGA